MYHLDFLEFPTLRRIDSDIGRKYETPHGIFPSVTTILSKTGDKSWLEDWKNAVGEEQAKMQSHLAASRGNYIHAYLENILLGRELPPKNFFYEPMAKSILKEFSRLGRILGIESMLYSKKLRAAGTTDLIAYFDGKLSILDYKTSNKEKYEIESYFIQAAFYAYMLYEMFGLVVKQLVIFLAIEEDYTCKVFTCDPKPFIMKALEISRQFYEKEI